MSWSVAWLLLALACTQLMLATGQVDGRFDRQPARRRQLAAACARNEQCGANQFCLPSALSASSRGVCAPCWRCCLFPQMYGSCPERCNCNAGLVCETREDCGSGLFCSVQDPWEMPTCQPCSQCTADSYELQGSCVIPCPSADMSGRADLPYLNPDHFVFLAFLAHDISQQGAYSPGLLLKSELDSWVAGQGLKGEQAAQAVGRMLLGDPEAVDTKSWMQVVSEGSSTSYICPAYDPEQPWNQQPAVTTRGCFCNATTSARTFRCPAGNRCSPATFLGLETDAPRDPTAQIFRAVCMACEPGEYCPEGTFIKDESNLDALVCPEGYYCPSPAVKRECPPGSFCTGRTTEPVTCDLQQLLLTDPNRDLPMKPDSVIERVRDKRDPIRGNYCPAGSTKPNDLCSAGSYCPNTSSTFMCPQGYYCKAQSTAPTKCPLLTHCPAGTTVPPLSFMALVIAAIVVCTIPLLQLAFTHLDNSIIMDADELSDKRALHRAAVASRMTFRLLKSIKVNHQSALENKYRGFGTVSPPITMEFESLGLRIRPRGGEVRNVLKGVSGSFAPRRLNAILGPSGCGKTTFLNVLCGKISNGSIMGQVRVNGEDVPIDRLKKVMGFVPQDDIVHEDLTVRENLNYSARLRLPSDMTRSRRRDIVHDALEMLGLSAIQHYRVGTVERRGISGGQRKRVNIGLELVAMPSLLFLDEPTSGLDATSSADILNSLVDMANLGMNIIMVIHQPRFSSFLMFDQVLLLGGGGHTVYLGSPSAAMLYFTKYLGYRFPDCENPSDILMDIIAGKVPCTGDPRLKSCSQLVEKWTTGGMAWVETLETLNPTMVTKMSEVDPAIILAIDEEFDSLDGAGTGQINAVQLVKLFGALKQEISLEDAIILIKKINAHRPASAKAAARSGLPSAASTPRTPAADTDGLTITKQQLLDAFQGVREANDEGNVDGAVQRNAAAKFYASHFLLPDLPEVKNYRAAIERRRRRQPHPALSSGAEWPSNTGDDSASRSPGLESASAGGYSNIDSDSYSVFGPDGNDAAGTPVVESIMRRSILAPNTYRRGGLVSSPGGLGAGGGSGGGASGATGNRTVRSVALLPGLTLNGSSTSTAKAATIGSGSEAVAAAGEGGGGSDGGSTAAAGGADNDGVAPSSGDLSAFAARQHYAAAAAAAAAPPPPAKARRPAPEIATDDGDAEYDEEEDVDYDEDGPLQFYNSQCVTVSCGVVADSLAAMEALAHADVPLPQLPRRVERSIEYGNGRDKRHTKIFNNIESYVKAYNELATAPSHKLDKLGARHSGLLRVQQLSLTRSGAFGAAASAAAAVAAAAARRRNSLMAAAAGAAAAAAGGGGSRTGSARRLPPRLRIDSLPGVVIGGGVTLAARRSSLARPARLSRAVEEDEESDGRPTADRAAALPPLLRALVSGAVGGPAPMASLSSGPVSEGLEGGNGGAADPARLLVPPPPSTTTTAAAEVEAAVALAVAAATEADAIDGPLRLAAVRNVAATPPPPLLARSTSRSSPLGIATRSSSGHGSREDSPRPLGEEAAALPTATDGEDLDMDPDAAQETPDPARQWRTHGSGRSRSGREFGREASRESVGDDVPSMLPLAPEAATVPLPPPPPLPTRTSSGSEARQWRRFGASLPRGSVADRPTGSVLVDPAVSAGGIVGDRPSRGGRAPQPSRFGVNRTPTGGGDSADGIVHGAAPAAEPLQPLPASEYDAGTAPDIRHLYGDIDCGGDDGDDDDDGDGGAAADTEDAAGRAGGAAGVRYLTRLRLLSDTARNNSEPLPILGEGHVGRSGTVSACGTPMREGGGGGSARTGRPRRSSLGPGGAPGRKQRRHSWLQNSDGNAEPTTPGGTRKTRKDTLYVNSLLSNALVGAWAATQSVTGRNNSALARTTRTTAGATTPSAAAAAAAAAAATAAAAAVSASAAAGSPEGGSPTGAAGAALGSFNTPMPPGGARAVGPHRAVVGGTGPVKVDSRAPSNMPGPLNSDLACKLDMEEALASRKAQGLATQLLFLLRRGFIKYVRSFWPMRVVDTLLQLAAAFIIGLVHGTRWGITSVPSNVVMCMVCLGVLSCVTHLRTFSNSRVLLWRESASGMSILAYFMSQNLIDQIWVFAAPGLSLGVYYYLTLPRMAFSEFYVVGLFVCWWASGMAYLVSALLPPQNVLMAGVFISLIFGAFLNGLTYSIATARGTLMEGIMGLSYNRWAMEIVTINELRNYQINHRNTIIMMGKGIGLCHVDTKLKDDGQPGISAEEAISYMRLQSDFDMDGYCSESKSVGYVALFVMGLGFRLLAYLFLRYSCVKRR